MDFIKRNAKRILLESLGWLLVAVGIVALVLPGPGLLAVFAGLALLAIQYEWAERRLHPIRKVALKTAAESVKSWPRIAVSAICSLGLAGLGVIWGLHPAAPTWWPLADTWWLKGGWGTGVALIGSAVIALAMIAYSHLTFNKKK